MDTKAFADAYATLNPEQKRAVDTVEGPVMVIAGPGTGKTHILTLRIANILRTAAQAGPENILALTFTESAARTVKKRLAGLIGEEAARKVGTYTFHGFAEDIMRRFPEAFPAAASSRLMGEVEQVLLWREVLDSREVQWLRTPKSPYFYLPSLNSLEDELTRERVTLDAYASWLADEEKRIEADDLLRYQKSGKHGIAGDLKPEGLKRLERLERGREAIELIRAYRDLKEARGLYGYTDVLRLAVDGLASDDALRADLQERYQYVLADEHQDANALQHALLDSLAFDEHPNLFIVGDEKQAIFSFQGADSMHFRTFLERYPRTEVITLTQNFRSYQSILDTAHTLLKDLPASATKDAQEGTHVELAAARGAGGRIRVLAAADPLAEREQVAMLVEEAVAEGIAPHEIAVITLKNATADLFALHLRAKGIPALRAGDIDLAGRPAVRFLLALMHAVADPNDLPALRDALLAPWWEEGHDDRPGIALAARAAFLRRYRDYELTDALATDFPEAVAVIVGLQQDAVSIAPLPLLSKLMETSGARGFFLGHGDQVEDVPLVRQLVMHIEDLVRRNPDTTFAEVMAALGTAREHGLTSVKAGVTQREGQVTVITAHKAKGMEFERVFVAALSEREWNGKGRASLIPSPLTATREFEEVVRLFYVALTRAKDELVLSYPAATGEGKELPPLSILPPGLAPIAPVVASIPAFHIVTDAPALVRDLTRDFLTHDGLSPSAFNEYLASPPTFFARRVLRLREPESPAIAIGNAVHAAIAGYLKAKDDGTAYAELERSLSRSLIPRTSAFDAVRSHARSCVASYLGSDLLSREVIAVEETYSLTQNIEGIDVILKGKADAVFKDLQPGHPEGVCIIDFKTSSSLTGKKEEFSRQLAFYDLLLRKNGLDPVAARIVQVGEDGVTEHQVALTDDVRASFTIDLDAVLRELIAGTWRAGEQSPYDDLLKLFAGGEV